MYRERIFGVLAKIEPTSGTDSVPTGTDAVRVVGIPTLAWDYLEPGIRDDVQNGTLIAVDRTEAAGRFGKIDITLEVKGGGAAGTAPECDAFLRASGRSKTVAAGVSVTYTTLDEGFETMTLYLYAAGKLFKMVGVACSMKLSADAAKRGMMTFSCTGKIVADPTEVAVPSLTFSAVLPPLFHSAAASIGAWTSASGDPLVLRSASFDDAATVAERPSAGATDGLIGFITSDRKLSQTMVVEVPTLAAFDPWSLSKAVGTSQPLSTWQIGTVAGNRLKIQTGKWSQRSPAIGAQNAINVVTLTGSLGTGAPTTARDQNLLWD